MTDYIVIPDALLTPAEAMQFCLKTICDLCITSTAKDRTEGYYSEMSSAMISIFLDLINNGEPIVGYDTEETTYWNSGIPDVEIEIKHQGYRFCRIYKEGGCSHVTELHLEVPGSKRHTGRLDFNIYYSLDADGKPSYLPCFS